MRGRVREFFWTNFESLALNEQYGREMLLWARMVKDYLTIPSMNNIDHGYFVNILGKDFPNSFFPLENFRKKQNVRMQFFVKLSGERNSLTRCVLDPDPLDSNLDPDLGFYISILDPVKNEEPLEFFLYHILIFNWM